jgi:hypothetical protein
MATATATGGLGGNGGEDEFFGGDGGNARANSKAVSSGSGGAASSANVTGGAGGVGVSLPPAGMEALPKLIAQRRRAAGRQ